MKILLMLLFILGTLTPSHASNNITSADFINNVVEKRGLKGCKKIISQMFPHDYKNIEVNTRIFPDEKNAVHLSTTYGAKGDSLSTDAFLRLINGSCVATITTTIVFNDSCLSRVSKLDNHTLIGEAADFTWFSNNTGSKLHMRPMGNGCIVTYLTDRK